MSRDIVDVQDNFNLIERVVTLGMVSKRWAKIIESLTDQELITLLKAAWNQENRKLEEDAALIWENLEEIE